MRSDCDKHAAVHAELEVAGPPLAGAAAACDDEPQPMEDAREESAASGARSPTANN
jgi:hypothetical protein